MSVKQIKEEEERRQKEAVEHARAAKKRKHQGISVSFLLEELEDEQEVIEEAASEAIDGASKTVTNLDVSNDGQASHDDREECGMLHTPPLLLLASQNASANHVDNQTEIIEKLTKRVAFLEKEMIRLERSMLCWRSKYKDVTQNKLEETGSTLIESVHKAVDVLMCSEDRYMELSGRRSEKTHYQY